MIRLNRGEWSELYTAIDLLCNPKMKVADSKLNIERETNYFVDSIIFRNNYGEITRELQLDDFNNIQILVGDYVTKTIDRTNLLKYRDNLLKSLRGKHNTKGSFSLTNIDKIIHDLFDTDSFKSGSKLKKDIELRITDKNRKTTSTHTYSIKSKIGKPATLLNASNNTNFLYKVHGLSLDQIKEINLINTDTKLLDRINKIYSLGGDISFVKVNSRIFESNLNKIDFKLKEILGFALLDSYKHNEKDLVKLLQMNKNINYDEGISILKSFLESICFGLFPGKPWDGLNTVDGGLIIVLDDGEIVILDLINDREELKNYLLKEVNLDSPSTTRYKMLELYSKNNEIFFTLNLQIRFKK